MRFGYARTSTDRQHLDMQLTALEEAGCDRIFQEQLSGAAKKRPEFEKMMELLREGDEVVVYSLSRLGRTLKGLLSTLEELERRGVILKSLNEQIDASTAAGRFLFNVLASLAELERDLARERSLDGLAEARRKGKKLGRPAADEKKMRAALALLDEGSMTGEEVAKQFGVSRQTLYHYRRLRDAGEL